MQKLNELANNILRDPYKPIMIAPHFDPFVVDIIVGFLPRTTQLKINKHHHEKVMPTYRCAKHTIVSGIVFHRHRMNAIMDSDTYGDESLDLIRAHYILHYPDEYRWDFYQQALAKKIKRNSTYSISAHLDSYENGHEYSVKHLFKQMVLDMSLDELFVIGW